MKLYLDDIRDEYPGWVRCYWPDEVIHFLKTQNVEEISLDHDLGDDRRGTGYDVLLWIEEGVVMSGYNPPKITIHTANISARQKMEAAANNIALLLSRRPK